MVPLACMLCGQPAYQFSANSQKLHVMKTIL
jgi:hypothetical protein